jgi:hypothetical protein
MRKEGKANYSHQKHGQPLENKNWQYACRQFRVNSHKVGAMLHICPLLGSCLIEDRSIQWPLQSNGNENNGRHK